ncbi:unnamed protein product [Aureobasidium mustum]|uniref:Trichothecene 3-O-acetyltransferase n=1 Tax=Aureobasidium mustum TaxID=2773714 RepID=A0A9N8JHR4_9PEZI|nr:unnamed protein product [Aureobasidium mustum]
MIIVSPVCTVPRPASNVGPELHDSLDHNHPPAHTLELSQLEQSNLRGWFRALLFFKQPAGVDPSKAANLFRDGLVSTVRAIPSVACEIVPFDDGRKPTGKIALKCNGLPTLVVKDLRGSGLVYEELQKQNFPQSRLEPTDFCTREVFPEPDEQQPVFVPQLNIIDGGLVLTLHSHHSVFNAQGINEVLRCDSLSIEKFGAAHNSSREPTADMGRPEHHPELIVAPEPITFGETAMRCTHRSRVYRVSPEALAQLRDDCNEARIRTSTNDRITALIWRSVIRAQVDFDQLPNENTLSHDIVNVDLRLRSEPPLAKDYPGCPMNYARAAMNLEDVFDSSITPLAFGVREAVNKRTHEYVRSLVTLLANAPSYHNVVSDSFRNLMTTHCLTSTWYKLDMYDLDFGPAIGKIECVRFPTGGLFNGLSMIYSQLTSGNGVGMEIAIGLDQCCFEKLEKDPIWCRYTKSTDPGYDCI